MEETRQRWFLCGIFRDKAGFFPAAEEGKQPERPGAEQIIIINVEISYLHKALEEMMRQVYTYNTQARQGIKAI